LINIEQLDKQWWI